MQPPREYACAAVFDPAPSRCYQKRVVAGWQHIWPAELGAAHKKSARRDLLCALREKCGDAALQTLLQVTSYPLAPSERSQIDKGKPCKNGRCLEL